MENVTNVICIPCCQIAKLIYIFYIKIKFEKLNVYINGGTEFYKKEINEKIEEYKKIIKSEIKMALIHAPPQVGKTNATKDFIEMFFDSGFSVIVSCDNKTNQMDQYDRMTEYFDGRENVVLVKASDSKFVNIVTEAFKSLKNVIIFCLDNSAQIFLKKLYHIEFIRIQV